MTATADATDSSIVEELIQTVEDLREDLAAAHERIDALEDELADHQDHDGREHAHIHQRITETEDAVETLEEHVPESDPTETASGDAANPETRTPLERIVALPEQVADRELTANQERARFIARDIQDYAEKAPAGLVIDSRAIKRVLTASEGKRPHTQTVARVMNFLDELGKDDIQQTKRRGKNLIVVDPDAADRYVDAADHSRCDQVERLGGTNAVTSGP